MKHVVTGLLDPNTGHVLLLLPGRDVERESDTRLAAIKVCVLLHSDAEEVKVHAPHVELTFGATRAASIPLCVRKLNRPISHVGKMRE